MYLTFHIKPVEAGSGSSTDLEMKGDRSDEAKSSTWSLPGLRLSAVFLHNKGLERPESQRLWVYCLV